MWMRLILLTLLMGGAIVSADGNAKQDPAKQKPVPKKDNSPGAVIEGRIRSTVFRYTVGVILGESEEYFKAVKAPLYSVRDGVGKLQDEATLKGMISRTAQRMAANPLSKDDRNQIVKNLVGTIDEAEIQFIGANSATVHFQTRKDPKTGADYFCSVTVFRTDAIANIWQVISETTDSRPVPDDYLK